MSAPAVTVALPIHRADGFLRPAFESITRQTLRDLELLVILNGADATTTRHARELAAGEPRARVIELPEANLAGALNVALEAARAPLIARMDADDLCPPERLAVQASRMRAEPALAALGCAWEVVAPDLAVLATVRPPTDPREARWRLLLGNPFAHGSMMLRRDAVLGAGGYDTACTRAQDFDLWLRLARSAGIAAVPQVLYQHRTRTPDDHAGSTPEQAAFAARALVSAWNTLPSGDDNATAAALAPALERGAGPIEAIPALELLLSAGPTRSALLAWLLAQSIIPPAPRRAVEACRLARLREIGSTLRRDAVKSVWLWGAGEHTRWLLGHAVQLGVPVAGIVDDACVGEERFGFVVQSPDAIPSGDTALLSSDWHEDAMWEASAPRRAAGVRIVRLYAA